MKQIGIRASAAAPPPPPAAAPPPPCPAAPAATPHPYNPRRNRQLPRIANLNLRQRRILVMLEILLVVSLLLFPLPFHVDSILLLCRRPRSAVEPRAAYASDFHGGGAPTFLLTDRIGLGPDAAGFKLRRRIAVDVSRLGSRRAVGGDPRGVDWWSRIGEDGSGEVGCGCCISGDTDLVGGEMKAAAAATSRVGDTTGLISEAAQKTSSSQAQSVSSPIATRKPTRTKKIPARYQGFVLQQL